MALQNAFGALALDGTLKDGTQKSQLLNTESQVDGTITANGQTVQIATDAGCIVTIFVYGAGHAGVNLTVEVSPNNVNWFPVAAQNAATGAILASGATGVITTNGSAMYHVASQASAYVRVRATAWTSGTLSVVLRSLAVGGPMVVTSVSSGTIIVDSELSASAALADGMANPTTAPVGAELLGFNGASWDRFRNNANVTVDTSSAKAATGNGATAVNFNAAGAKVFVHVTAVSGTTPTMVVKLQESHNGTDWVDIPGANTVSITANGVYVLTLYPGVPAVANQSIPLPLPRTWRCVWTIGGTTPSFTFSTVAAYIL